MLRRLRFDENVWWHKEGTGVVLHTDSKDENHRSPRMLSVSESAEHTASVRVQQLSSLKALQNQRKTRHKREHSAPPPPSTAAAISKTTKSKRSQSKRKKPAQKGYDYSDSDSETEYFRTCRRVRHRSCLFGPHFCDGDWLDGRRVGAD